MAFVYVVICCVVGFAVGGITGQGSMAAFGFFAGIAFGVVFARVRTLSMRIAALEKRPAVAPAADVSRTAAARSMRPLPLALRWQRLRRVARPSR